VPGDVIAFLHPNFLRPSTGSTSNGRAGDRPGELPGLGLANGAEEFVIPVVDLTYDHPTLRS
jgi:hypothetical protein